jgi:hypothetical protein
MSFQILEMYMLRRQLADCILITLLLAGCNLQSPDATAALTETPAGEGQPDVILPTIPAVLPAAEGQQEAGVCYFVPYGIGAPFNVLSDPETAQVQPVALTQIDANIYYPVVSQLDVWVQLVAAEGVVGWVRYGIGAYAGPCDSIPRSTNRPVPPEGICTVYFDKVMSDEYFFVDQEGTTRLEPLVPGQYFPVEARGSNRALKVTLPDGRAAWVLTPEQLLSMNQALNGPCDTLPVEESTMPGG